MLRTIRNRVRLMLGSHPALYFPAAQLSRKHRALGIRRDTELVVEGYPRSGNSFAVRALQMSQPAPVRVAHHLHVPAQIQRASDWRIPALVLIRRPTDAVVSSLQRLPWQSAEAALMEWLWFYRSVDPIRSSYVTASFDDVTTRFGTVVERVNARFGTRFVPFDHTAANVERIFQGIDTDAKALNRGANMVSRPTPERQAEKAAVARRLEAPRCRALLAECNELFDAFGRAP